LIGNALYKNSGTSAMEFSHFGETAHSCYSKTTICMNFFNILKYPIDANDLFGLESNLVFSAAYYLKF